MGRGLLVITTCVLLGVIGLRFYSGVPGRDYRTLYVSTPIIGNLLPHDSVRISGARVGQVLSRDIGTDGRPRLKLQINPGVTVPEDTQVAVRASGLLGARYVELIPGTSRTAARDGLTLDGSATSYTYGLPEAIDIFDGPARTGLKHTIDNLGGGLFGNGRPLNRTLKTLATRTGQFDVVAREVLQREDAARRLLPALDAAITPLDRNRRDAPAFDRGAIAATGPFVAQRAATREALGRAPATLSAAQEGLGKGRRLVSSLRRLSAEANEALPLARPGLHAVAHLLGEGPVSLPRAEALLQTVPTAVPGALRITGAVRPLLPDVNQLVVHAAPILAEVVKRKCDVVNFGEVMRSMTGFSQPGSGPGGPASAFRLQVAFPLSADAVGIGDPFGLVRRDTDDVPCRYPSTVYPQFVPSSLQKGR